MKSPLKKALGTAADRRTFLAWSVGAAGLALCPETMLFAQATTAGPASSVAQQPSPAGAAAQAQRPEPLKSDLVKEFVIAAHGNLDKTKTMLADTPALLNATWDWGGGDFEMAIGGAGHMGRRDIALFLISQGGRFDLFVAAMLGRLDVVKPMLTAFPHLADSKGPHGIPLMVHAQKGGQEAAEVAAFLDGLKT
jgi:hypothetical protein